MRAEAPARGRGGAPPAPRWAPSSRRARGAARDAPPPAAQVWLARKKSTGDTFAIKAMEKEHVRGSGQGASINVEAAILRKHDSEYLVRSFYSFRSAHHIYIALEYMPGGDLRCASARARVQATVPMQATALVP